MTYILYILYEGKDRIFFSQWVSALLWKQAYVACARYVYTYAAGHCHCSLPYGNCRKISRSARRWGLAGSIEDASIPRFPGASWPLESSCTQSSTVRAAAQHLAWWGPLSSVSQGDPIGHHEPHSVLCLAGASNFKHLHRLQPDNYDSLTFALPRTGRSFFGFGLFLSADVVLCCILGAAEQIG